jgi:sulfur-carrier protein adenylyltransferase/sulfurtransferase
MLSTAEKARYARHTILPQVGEEGQDRLKQASVLLVGAGGLGSPAALYLAAAGVGRLGLIDFDTVDASNLQRQILYGTSDSGKRKVEAAELRLKDLNPHIDVEPIHARLDSSNARRLIRGFDLVLDGTDNFATRYLVNDACVLENKPNVYGSIFRFEGQVSVFGAPDGPCYRCIYPEPPPPGSVPSCAEGGVFGVLPGIVGSIQAAEAIRLILGIGSPLIGRLLLFDALEMSFRELRMQRDPQCPLCGAEPSIHDLIDYDTFCGTPREGTREMSASELRALLGEGRSPAVLDVRTRKERAASCIEGSLHIPLDELEGRSGEMRRAEGPVVVYCRSGVRSARAVAQLEAAGIEAVSLKGGILAWEADESRGSTS